MILIFFFSWELIEVLEGNNKPNWLQERTTEGQQWVSQECT